MKGLLAPTEIMKACEKFQELNLPVKLISFDNGVKVIEACKKTFLKNHWLFIANYDSVKDFEENIMKLIDNVNGITAEQLSKKLKISLIVSRLKLEVILNFFSIVHSNVDCFKRGTDCGGW